MEQTENFTSGITQIESLYIEPHHTSPCDSLLECAQSELLLQKISNQQLLTNQNWALDSLVEKGFITSTVLDFCCT